MQEENGDGQGIGTKLKSCIPFWYVEMYCALGHQSIALLGFDDILNEHCGLCCLDPFPPVI